MDKIKIDDYRLLPAGKPVWSISLQENITFIDDQVIKVRHLLESVGEPDFFDGKLQLMHLGVFYEGFTSGPSFVDKTNGDLGSIRIEDTKEFVIDIGDTII